MTQTLTTDRRPTADRGERAVVRGDQLVLAMDLADPIARPARFSISAASEVLIGRGTRRKTSRSPGRDGESLRVEVPDAFMSGTHLRLLRVDGRWFAEDGASKNGTWLNGERLGRAALEDGDLFALGNTIFLFRRDVATFEGEGDVDLSGTPMDALATTTLHTGFAADLTRLSRVAASSVPVLIRGETGAGKELVARAIHEESRRAGDFVAVNCGALPPALITSELFGAKKGAYSGATENRRGLVRGANTGTLFLDEIAELPLPAQSAFLRVLQEDEVLPVGGDKPFPVDVRAVAATHGDLRQMVAAGTFREDLFSRVAGYEFEIPPLRARREDIGLLVGNILRREGLRGVSFTQRAGRALFDHSWPQNVRQLEHALRAAAAVAGGGLIDFEHLPVSIREATPNASVASEATPTADELPALLARHHGNVSAVARALGTSRSQVRRLAKRRGLDPDAYRRSS